MRKKLQDKMFELSYIFEFFISVIVGIAILILAVRMIVDTLNISVYLGGASSLVTAARSVTSNLLRSRLRKRPQRTVEDACPYESFLSVRTVRTPLFACENGVRLAISDTPRARA